MSGAGAGHPAAVVQRHPLTCQWQSQGTVGAKSRRRSFMEEQGLLCPGPASPPSNAPCSEMASTTARSPSGGLQLMAAEALAATPEDLGAADLEPAVAVAVPANGTRAGASKGRRAGTNGPRRTKAVIGPNQTPRTSLQREAKFLPQRQLPPGGDPYQVAEATKEEIETAAARQAEREEEGFHAHLWQEAAQQALADPDRPLCARELVKNGRLTAWWSMSWKDARTQIDVALVDEYRDLLRVTLWAPRMDPGCCLSRSWRGALASSPGSSKTTGQSFKLKGELLRAASSRFLARWWSFSQPPYAAPPTRSQPTTATH